MTSTVEQVPILVNQYVAASGNDEPLCQSYVQKVNDLFVAHKLSLLQFIRDLGQTLTSDNDMIRSKGLEFLARVLNKISQDHDKDKDKDENENENEKETKTKTRNNLTRQDVGVMINFLLSKLDDKLSLIHALNGINSLVRSKAFVFDLHAELILDKLSTAYEPRKNLAKVRYEAFQILESLADLYMPLLTKQPICDHYVRTFLHIALGEKDPRNLVSSFKLNITINQNFKFNDDSDNEILETHKTFISELFDTCFCYFPISFTPPANDPYKITPNELKERLRKTIASQSKFAPDSFPSLIEKLASTNPSIRNDTLKTINLCVQEYDVEAIDALWLSLWNALKFEILHNDMSLFKPTSSDIIPSDYVEIDDNDDIKVTFQTLDILRNIVKKLGNNASQMLQVVIEESVPNLVSGSKSRPSVVLLVAVGGANNSSYNKLLNELFRPQVWGKYFGVESQELKIEGDDIGERNAIMDKGQIEADAEDKNEEFTLNVAMQRDLVDNLGFLLMVHPKNEQTDLVKYKDHILIFLNQILMNSSDLERTLKVKAVQQSMRLITIPHFLTTANIELILDNMKEIIIKNVDDDENYFKTNVVVDEITKGLSNVMQETNNPTITTLVVNNMINPLLNMIGEQNKFNNIDSDEDKQGEKRLRFILTLVGDMCVNNQILEVISIRLIGMSSIEPRQFCIVVEQLYVLIEKVQLIKQFLTTSWYGNFVPRFMQMVNKMVDIDSQDYILVEKIGDLLKIIIRFIDRAKHQHVLDEAYHAFFTSTSDGSTNTFQYNSNLLETPTAYISIFNKILSAIDRSCKLNTASSLDSVTRLIPTLTNEYLRVQYLLNLCLHINKFVLDSSVIDMGIETDELEQLDKFEIYLWKLKALVMRVDKAGIEGLSHLLKLFNSYETSILSRQLIAKSLSVLFIDTSIFTNPPLPKKIISKVTNLNVKLLYKQHLFEIILPYLTLDIGETEAGVDSPISDFDLKFYALANICENVPTNVLAPHLAELSPLVLKALKSMSTTVGSEVSPIVIKSSLHILRNILEHGDKSTIDNLHLELGDLLSILLKLSTREDIEKSESSNLGEEIRRLGLIDLGLIFDKFDCEKYKRSVLKSLEKCLDDPKRSIRKLAVDLRQTLYEMR